MDRCVVDRCVVHRTPPLRGEAPRDAKHRCDHVYAEAGDGRRIGR
ncbi:hypothetical protein GLA29479_2620 [Lysobacter antibioticus]|nr:hypothetical protein GLA29479_2620 [Lysobacter antibioticus]